MTIQGKMLLAVYTLLIIIAVVLGYDEKQNSEIVNNPNWNPQNNDASLAYMYKRRFGQLKFGKRPFGTVKFGKRNMEENNSEWTDDNEDKMSDSEEKPISAGVVSKRYSDVLDNLYLQTVLHKLNERSDPWNKRGKILFGKRSDDDDDDDDDDSSTMDKRYKLKFGKRPFGPILHSWYGQNWQNTGK